MRKEGFYWVKYNGDWIIAFYNETEKRFELTMSDDYYRDAEFDNIDDFPITRN